MARALQINIFKLGSHFLAAHIRHIYRRARQRPKHHRHPRKLFLLIRRRGR